MTESASNTPGTAGGSRRVLLLLGWVWVGAPFAYGLYELALKLKLLLTG
ncbi:MFS transporter small subunit [Streptomyces meridianus]|uniref:Oxalate:formate antiporter n=1 Tax=Streptomyces meridianus TaxID=2938945 RepID=A0ABT0X6R6_9ACTN|nr:hypothetical protein [Streptomyces meridianus]MCM2578211.1 hypothetical protein [Streptomyces meridianus]